MTQVLFFTTFRFQSFFSYAFHFLASKSYIKDGETMHQFNLLSYELLTLLDQIRTSEMSYKRWIGVSLRNFIFISHSISLVTICIPLPMQRSSLGTMFPNMSSEGHVIFHVQDKFEIHLFQTNSSVLYLPGSCFSLAIISRFCTKFSWVLLPKYHAFSAFISLTYVLPYNSSYTWLRT